MLLHHPRREGHISIEVRMERRLGGEEPWDGLFLDETVPWYEYGSWTESAPVR